jgi:hypothetical protein
MRFLILILTGVGLVTAAVPCAAQEYGRLFFTPEQRAQLDGRRKARVPDKPAAAAVVASPTTRIDGYVRRSSGPSTVFINGESLTEGPQPDSPRVGRDASVSLPVGESGERVGLKPGETLDRGSGEVRDVLGAGELRVRRPAAKSEK